MSDDCPAQELSSIWMSDDGFAEQLSGTVYGLALVFGVADNVMGVGRFFGGGIYGVVVIMEVALVAGNFRDGPGAPRM